MECCGWSKCSTVFLLIEEPENESAWLYNWKGNYFTLGSLIRAALLIRMILDSGWLLPSQFQRCSEGLASIPVYQAVWTPTHYRGRAVNRTGKWQLCRYLCSEEGMCSCLCSSSEEGRCSCWACAYAVAVRKEGRCSCWACAYAVAVRKAGVPVGHVPMQ